MEKLLHPTSTTEPDACSERDKTRKPARHPDGKFLPGVSGNLKGRPPGVFTQASVLVRTLLEENAATLTQTAIAQAIAGNPIALKLCLERLAAPTQSRAVQFDLTTKAHGHTEAANTPDQLLAQHNAVLQSVADGALTPSEGQQISSMLDSRRRAWETAFLSDRLSAFEDNAQALKSAPKTPTIRWIENSESATTTKAPVKRKRSQPKGKRP